MKTFSISAMLCLLVLVILFSAGCKKEKDDDNPSAPTTVKDVEGNVYNVVKIGNQYWMKENLRTTRYRNGDIIPTTTPPEKDISSDPTPKYQWAQNYTESLAQEWGRVYTAYVISDPRGVCPAGWRVPSEDDFNELIQNLIDSTPPGNTYYPELILSPNTNHWDFLPGMAGKPLNALGFSLMGGGIRINEKNGNAIWSQFKSAAYIMSSNVNAQYNFSPSLCYIMGGKSMDIQETMHHSAAHIRCLKD